MKRLWMAGLELEPDNCNVLDASAASRVSHNRHSLSSETLLGKEVKRAGRRGYGPLFEGHSARISWPCFPVRHCLYTRLMAPGNRPDLETALTLEGLTQSPWPHGPTSTWGGQERLHSQPLSSQRRAAGEVSQRPASSLEGSKPSFGHRQAR